MNVSAGSIIAVPKENSNISANAVFGQGGNIQITTQGIFGLKFRDQLTSDSDITASSQFGVTGTVQVNTIGVDPSSGLKESHHCPITTSYACPTRDCQHSDSLTHR
jgi:large exoprotein involved in heme utilization and adhesion